MESFLNFFETMPTWQRLTWVVSCLVVCWILEGNFPLFNFSYKKWKHAGVNFVFLTTTMIINVIFGIVTVGVFVWIKQYHIGLTYYIDLPIWLSCSSVFSSLN